MRRLCSCFFLRLLLTGTMAPRAYGLLVLPPSRKDRAFWCECKHTTPGAAMDDIRRLVGGSAQACASIDLGVIEVMAFVRDDMGAATDLPINEYFLHAEHADVRPFRGTVVVAGVLTTAAAVAKSVDDEVNSDSVAKSVHQIVPVGASTVAQWWRAVIIVPPCPFE